MPPLGFKARVGCLVCIGKANIMYSLLRSISGATPADLFASQMATRVLPRILLPVEVGLPGLEINH